MPITPTTATNVELPSSSTLCAESTQIHKNDANITIANVCVTAENNSALPLILQSPQHNIKVSNVADVGGGGGGGCGTVTATTSSISSLATVATNTTTTTVCKRRFSSTTITTDIISTNNNVDEQKQNHADDSQPPQQRKHEPTNSNGSNSGINSIGVGSDANVATAAAALAADGVMVKNIAKEEKVSQQHQQHQEKATNVVSAKSISIVSESAGITLNRYDTQF